MRIDFSLPPELEAREPPEARGLGRDGVRLLVSYLTSDRTVHARFVDLPAFLRRGDLLVVNISATLPAALVARRRDGSEVAMHLSTHLPAELFVVEFRKVTVSAGEVFQLPGGASAVALVPYSHSARLWVARLDLPEPLLSYLRRWGRPIVYPYVRGSWPIDMYQNVYASVPGSAEMPSAGRPFTEQMIDRLTSAGVRMASVLLHSGVASLEVDEPPYEEYFEVPHDAAAEVQRTREEGGRVIAVGTTVVRALESSVDGAGRPIASRGWTDLVITPRRGVTAIDGLLTGFHEPKATHLALLEAIAGRPHLERAYRAAIEAGYLWHEFGDLHLILPDWAPPQERVAAARNRDIVLPDDVRQVLESAGAIRRGHFRLTSGLHSDLFLLCAQVMQYPHHTARLAAAMAEPFRDARVQVVVGTAVGGIVLGYEVARQLGVRAIFAEKSGTDTMVLRRGFALRPEERALVIEDALTTGGSIRKVIETVREYGARVVGVSVLVDRSGGAVHLGVPVRALLTLNVDAWEPAHCPLCREGVPLVEPKESG